MTCQIYVVLKIFYRLCYYFIIAISYFLKTNKTMLFIINLNLKKYKIKFLKIYFLF